MDASKSQLLAMLDKIAASLPADAEQHINEARRLVLASEYAELEQLTGSNGGLGSYEAEFRKLNDMLRGESWGDLGG